MCVFVCTLLKIKMMYYFFVDIKSAANHMLETCRVIVLFQYLHGDNVRIRLKSGPPLFVFVLVRLFRGLCKNPPKCKYIFNVSSFFFSFFFFLDSGTLLLPHDRRPTESDSVPVFCCCCFFLSS